jgi:hypothetical protein
MWGWVRGRAELATPMNAFCRKFWLLWERRNEAAMAAFGTNTSGVTSTSPATDRFLATVRDSVAIHSSRYGGKSLGRQILQRANTWLTLNSLPS